MSPFRFSLADAISLAEHEFGLTVQKVWSLPGERDQNFAVQAKNGRLYVLKLIHPAEGAEVIQMQHAALKHLATHLPQAQLPRVCHTMTGAELTHITANDGTSWLVRLLTFVPGQLWAETRPHSPALYHSLGRFLGELDNALAEFDHPAAHRSLKWNLAEAAWIADFVSTIPDSDRQAMVRQMIAQFETAVLPQLPHLPHTIIHSDANDYNLITQNGRVVGIIDFGDMVYAPTICELAIAIAYAILNKIDPLTVARHIIRGYHQARPLTPDELAVLFPLICTRLCVTVTNAALAAQQQPENAYLQISAKPAWETLSRLQTISPDFAHYAFRAACDLPPCPKTAVVLDWLTRHQKQIQPVLHLDMNQAVVLDLSVGSTQWGTLDELQNPTILSNRIQAHLAQATAPVGVGRYNEARLLYTAPAFQTERDEFPERRTIHLGIDLFAPAGTAVYAPLSGKVHSLTNHTTPGDYGPTLILAHTTDTGHTFYTLYGHLSRHTISHLHPGQSVAAGDLLGHIGTPDENGNWPPHLHFQLITDLLAETDTFPGVAAPSEAAIWLAICPDPNIILQIPAELFPPPSPTTAEILVARRQHIGPSLSISYHKPLHIVRGFMQYLYNNEGQAYLDAVNNVPHVGHCHPHVVRAAQQQTAVLNTNTRYLHPNLVRYAQRLCATLPEPLRVCFFVNSGSEANDLALRLAFAHTGRRGIIVLDGAYHGNLSSLIDISPYKFNGPGGQGAPPHVFPVPMPDPYRGVYRGEPEAGKKYGRLVQNAIIQAEAKNYPIAAFIAEPLLGCGGQIVPPNDFFATAYAYVRAAGGVCIADEVQVGFGRVGSHFWAFQLHGIIPDIVTMGKPIGNGHPLAAVVTTPEIAASFANGMEYFNTFGGNPVSCAVGMAVLDVIENEQLQQNADQIGRYLLNDLRQLMDTFPLVGDVRGRGLFIGVELVRNRETLEPATQEASYIVERMRDHGILISTDGPLHNVLKIKPPLVFNTANAERLVTTLKKVLAELPESGK
ncbi:MAG: aminotransferase class III-fold pyridoxal phosphate-dependent enzyme [Chloroflexi bacterium]|nr:MAG: aminotransferase class III-fold pyridoxal phosphate-dependent enzyme [Chloroflexota bacterium]